MSRRKQAKPARILEDEATLNGKTYFYSNCSTNSITGNRRSLEIDDFELLIS